MFFRLALALLPILATPLAATEPSTDGKALAKEIAPYVDDRTVLVAHIDVSRLAIADLKEALAALLGPQDTEAAAQCANMLVAFRKAGGTRVFVVYSLANLLEGPFFIVPGIEGANKVFLQQVFQQLGIRSEGGVAQLDGALFFGPPTTLVRLRAGKPTPIPELAAALDDPADAPLRLAVIAGPDTRRALSELLPPLPPAWGGVEMKPFVQGIRWIRLSVSLKPLSVRGVALCQDEVTAGKLRQEGNTILQAIQKGLKEKDDPMANDLSRLLARMMPAVSGNQLVVTVNEKDLTEIIRPIFGSLRGAQARTMEMMNLKQIGLALHSYHGAKGMFPAAASYDTLKKPLLSWRVHLLPYLGQAQLYKQFKLDEAWDSPHNKTLIEKMPAIYAATNPKLAAAGKTTILAPRGDETMFPGTNGTRMAEVTDGAANTIFLVDAQDDRAVFWTQPEDLPFDPRNPHAGLRFGEKDMTLCLRVDGGVVIIPKSMSKEDLKAAFTRNGGEVFEWK